VSPSGGAASAGEFRNSYDATGKARFIATKELENLPLQKEAFSFRLTGRNVAGGGLVVIGVVEDKENNKNKPQEELSPQYEYKKGDEDEFLRRLKEKLLTPAGEWAVPPPPKDKNSQHNGKDTAEKAAPCFFAIYDEDRAEYGILRSRVHISLFKKADKTATGCIAVFIPSVQHPIRVLDIKQKGLSHTTLLLQRCETAGEVSAMAGDSIRKIMKDFTPEPYEESFRQLAFKLNTLL